MRAGPPRCDDRGSMSMFLIVALVGLMLGALLVPMVITSARSTRTSTTRVQALDVALAGIDVTLGKVRAATDTDGLGDATDLPCTPDGSPITGSVGLADYSVTVDYFTVDPDKNPTTNGTPDLPEAGLMLCVPGYGTYLKGIATPSFARFTAVGTVGQAVNGTTAGRKLITTYALQTSNTNIAGGTIRIYPNGSAPSLCIDAGSGTPAPSTALVVQGCIASTPPAAQQTFAYKNDLTIQLVSSVSAAYPTGLCLSTAESPGEGSPALLKACPAVDGTPAYTQQWSYNDNGQYQAALPASSTDGGLSGQCLGIAAQAAAIPVKLAPCGTSSTGWIPAPTVGAGAAAQPQWVNASEFGRCLDVTNQQVGSNHLIDYPCKQNPYAGEVRWNQKFTPPTLAAGAASATGIFYTTPNLRYCLTSPSAAGGYATVALCVPLLASQQWTVYGGDSTLSYSKKYTIVDSAGRCLGVTDPYGTDDWSAIAVDTCDGSTSQKWNASPNLTTPKLQNTREK